MTKITSESMRFKHHEIYINQYVFNHGYEGFIPTMTITLPLEENLEDYDYQVYLMIDGTHYDIIHELRDYEYFKCSECYAFVSGYAVDYITFHGRNGYDDRIKVNGNLSVKAIEIIVYRFKDIEKISRIVIAIHPNSQCD